VVDIGSAEGYYATGLALRVPAARVVCFDTDRLANRLMLRLAKTNGTRERIQAGGYCDPAVLNQVLESAANPFVICDAEGAEMDILRPDQAPRLARAMLIVEVHEKQRPGVAAALLDRFAATHDLESVPVQPRVPQQAPSNLRLDDEDAMFAMDEQRLADQHWLIMRPRPGASATA
jgi:hypothetical protein